VTERFGGVEKDAAPGLGIRHDHGSQYMSRDFQKEIAWLGAASSPAFVRAPEGNGCAERFIRTLKQHLLWVRTFRTVEELRLAPINFRRTYNESWLIERHGYRSPAQFKTLLRKAAARTVNGLWAPSANSWTASLSKNAPTTSPPAGTMQIDRKTLCPVQELSVESIGSILCPAADDGLLRQRPDAFDW
jgi:hypothetical protein